MRRWRGSAGRDAATIEEFALEVQLRGGLEQRYTLATLGEARVEPDNKRVTMRRSGYTPRADFEIELTRKPEAARTPLRYNLLDPNYACSLLTPGQLFDEANRCFAGTSNYYYFLTDPAFFKAMANSLILVGWVLLISVVGGTLLALLLDAGQFLALAARQFAEPFLLACLVAQVGDDLGLCHRESLEELMVQRGLVRIVAAVQQGQCAGFTPGELSIEQA